MGLVGLSGCKRRQFTGFDNRLKSFFFKQLLIFYCLTIPSPDEEREVDLDLGTFADEEEGDIDDGSDVELDLDLDSKHNDDDLESDTLYSPIQWIELALQRNFSEIFQNRS